jgi:hypothetical protein
MPRSVFGSFGGRNAPHNDPHLYPRPTTSLPPGLDLDPGIRYLKTYEIDAHQVGMSGVLSHVTPALLLSGFQTHPIHLKAA